MSRRLVSVVLAMGVTLAFVGCSTKSKDEPAANQEPTLTEQDKAMAEEYAKLPGVVIEVPRDEQGNLKNSEAKMALYSGSAESISDVTADAIWTDAKTANVVASTDELDADSSTQSWHDPRPNYNNGGQDFGGGNYTGINISDINNSNVNVDVNNNNNNYYGNYYPRAYSLVNTNSYWAYNQRPYQFCRTSCCRFYYPRPACQQSWNWCGYSRTRFDSGSNWYNQGSGFGYQQQYGYGSSSGYGSGYGY